MAYSYHDQSHRNEKSSVKPSTMLFNVHILSMMCNVDKYYTYQWKNEEVIQLVHQGK